MEEQLIGFELAKFKSHLMVDGFATTYEEALELALLQALKRIE